MNKQTENLSAKIALRPAVFPDDESFLIELYSSTREDLTVLPIGGEQINALLQMQYAAQKHQYETMFPDAQYNIILFENQPVGRMINAPNAAVIYIVDLSLLPQYRSLGIGTFLLESSLKEASKTKRILRFSVLKTNRALRLYTRLGFKITGDTEIGFEMESEDVGKIKSGRK